jgi:transcriptional regulator with XRE-family HTH domain
MVNDSMPTRLRQYIDGQGLSRKLIAANMNVSESKLSLMLNGQRRITVDEYFDLCKAMAVDPRQFIPE